MIDLLLNIVINVASRGRVVAALLVTPFLWTWAVGQCCSVLCDAPGRHWEPYTRYDYELLLSRGSVAVR